MDTKHTRPSSGTSSRVPILAVEALTRHFGGLTAVNRCSFRIEAGRITGIIGPNGAGKTTIFNMVAGALPPRQAGSSSKARTSRVSPPIGCSTAGSSARSRSRTSSAA